MSARDLSDTRYAATGDGVDLAYRLAGEGPFDVLWCFSQLSDVEVIWEHPPIVDFLTELGAGARLVVHDRRGMGRSGGVQAGLDTDVSDLLVVLDAIGSRRAWLLGAVAGGAIYAAFARKYPERVFGLVWHGAFARMTSAPDYEWGETPVETEEYALQTTQGWGTDEFAADFVAGGAPSMAGDTDATRFFARWMQRTSGAAAAADWLRTWASVDLRALLPQVEVPALLTIRGDDEGESAHVASLIPNARHLALDGEDFMPFYNMGPVVAAIREFMVGARRIGRYRR